MRRLEITAQKKMKLITISLVLMQISPRCCAILTDENNSGWRCDFDDDGNRTSLSAQSNNVLEICNGWTIPVTRYNVTDFVVTSGNECYDNATARGGPPKDYSLRTHLGRYALFMSNVEEETRVAQLLSPWFKSSSNSNISLEFAMNMYGDGDRDLSVHVRRTDRSDARLWVAYGDKGTSWIHVTIAVGRLLTDYQFVFRAVRGTGDIGHIALDSIVVRENNEKSDSAGDHCPVARFRCQTELCISRGLLCDMENNCLDGDDEDKTICSTRVPLRCDFETDSCGWKNVGSSGIIWKRLRAMERKTGPGSDHTTATDSGHFIQAEAEEDSMGQNAIFESPLLPPPPPDHYNTSSPNYNTCQLRFFYFMKGGHISGLYVHLKERPRGCRGCVGRSHQRFLQPLGHSGISRWLRSSFSLPLLTHRFVIQFEAVMALPTSGIVAIDDVSMTTECHNDAYDIMSDAVKEAFQEEKINSQPTIEYDNETLHGIVDADVNPFVHTPGVISAAVVVCAFLLAILVFLSIYFVGYQRQRRLKAERLLRLSNPERSLSTLQTFSPRGQGIVAEYNPNYYPGAVTSSGGGAQELRELSRDRLILVRALGQGAFGEVFQGYLSTCDSVTIPVAAKTLAAMSTSQAEMDFLMEALIMSKFKHPNIVRFIGVCFEKHPKLIILELLNGGDVKTFLRKSRNTPERTSDVNYVDLVQLALDVGSGCEYLESNHFIHRDVAARNCLLTTRTQGRVAKIADFGMAKDIYGADYYRKGGKVMLPVKWMPPEAFLDGIFTSKTDVWSFGVLLWEIFTFGHVPYPGRGNQEVMTFVTEGGRLETPACCPPPAYDLMTLCWMADPDKRPSFRYVVDRLKSFLADADVIAARLPVFHIKDSRKEAWLPNPPSGELQPNPSPQQFQKPRNTTNPDTLEFQCEDLRPERSDSWLLRSDSCLMLETEA